MVTPPRVSMGQKFRLPLLDEQVMDCALAAGAAAASRAMMPNVVSRNPRIRMRNPSGGMLHGNSVLSPTIT
jgi:hypothetical protein